MPTPPRPTAGLPKSELRADEVWAAYSKRWSETDDYVAEFRQKIVVAGLGTEVESAGRFSFLKPDLVLWEYLEGPPQTVVGDGTFLWVHQPDLEQVYKVDYQTAFGSGGLVALLADREGLDQRYRSGIREGEDGSVVIVLVPLKEDVGSIEISVTPTDFGLRGVRVTDPSGSVTHMTFHSVVRNAGVDKERFAFTAPKGVDIITSPVVEF